MNKTEKKRQRRVTREREQQQQRWQQRGVKAALWVVPLILVVVIGYFVYQIMAEPLPLAGEVTAADHVKGNTESEVILVKYSDFQCPACKVYNDVIHRAWPTIQDQVQVVYRHFPLSSIHQHAELAAAYAEAAGRQGRFWEMHDMLFDNQAVWEDQNDAASLFDGYARRLGLDMDQLAADVDSIEIQEKIRVDQRSGAQSGVAGTPSFFLNGERLENPRSEAGFIHAIQEAGQQ